MNRYHVTKNRTSIDCDKVISPECYILAESYLEAFQKPQQFLASRNFKEDIELITPMEIIEFQEVIKAKKAC